MKELKDLLNFDMEKNFRVYDSEYNYMNSFKTKQEAHEYRNTFGNPG